MGDCQRNDRRRAIAVTSRSSISSERRDAPSTQGLLDGLRARSELRDGLAQVIAVKSHAG
jgi:hypothetical protein